MRRGHFTLPSPQSVCPRSVVRLQPRPCSKVRSRPKARRTRVFSVFRAIPRPNSCQRLSPLTHPQRAAGSGKREAGSGPDTINQMVPWILIGYAVGSVPFAFLLARRAGIDVLVAGSGNVGASNVLRTSRAQLGVAVMALDITKGIAAVLAAHAAAGG